MNYNIFKLIVNHDICIEKICLRWIVKHNSKYSKKLKGRQLFLV